MVVIKRSSEAVIDEIVAREVTGVFGSRKQLDAAVSALLAAGFDRSDIDVFAGSPEQIERRLGARVAIEELPDLWVVPRQDLVTPDDIGVTRVVIGGVLTAAVGFGLAAWLVGFGKTGLVIFIVGAATALFLAWLMRRQRASELALPQPPQGFIVWIRVRSLERARQAQQILHAHAATAVRIHEIPIDKHVHDLPLSSLRPDPWLGQERLGEP